MAIADTSSLLFLPSHQAIGEPAIMDAVSGTLIRHRSNARLSHELLLNSSATIVVISGRAACTVPPTTLDNPHFEAVFDHLIPAIIDAIHRDDITHSLNESLFFHVIPKASAISSAIEVLADASFSSAHDNLNPV